VNNIIACTIGGYHGSELDRVFLGLSKAGFRYVELASMQFRHERIPIESMSAEDISRLAESMKSHDLTPVSLSGHCIMTTEEGLGYFKRRIDFARDLGIGIINTGTTAGESSDEAEQFFLNMKGIIPYAKERGVRIALETHGGITATAQDCQRTLERLDSDWVGINYDTANVIYYNGLRPEEDIISIASHVIHVHLKDKRGGINVLDFPPLGDGDIDFEAIVRVLDAVGYKGPYSAEIEMETVDDPEEEDRIMERVHGFMQELARQSQPE
jgi:sugar phosphate isomerase/epimerase